MFSRILLASDGSGDANQAATAAASLAERFGAQMHILHVFSLLPPDSARTDVSPFHDQSSILQGVVERWAEKSADEVGHRIKRAEFLRHSLHVSPGERRPCRCHRPGRGAGRL